MDTEKPWHVRLMVADGTSAGFGAGDSRLNLYSFTSDGAVVPGQVFRWDGLGDGYWDHSPHWIGAGTGDIPSDTIHALVRVNDVTVDGDAAALSLMVQEGGQVVVSAGGVLRIAQEMEVADGSVTVAPGGTLSVGTNFELGDEAAFLCQVADEANSLVIADNDLYLGGTLSIQAIGDLGSVGNHSRTIFQSATEEGAVTDAFADEPPPGDHLGNGVLHQGVMYTATTVDVHLFQAAAGDTDGNRENAGVTVEWVAENSRLVPKTSKRNWVDAFQQDVMISHFEITYIPTFEQEFGISFGADASEKRTEECLAYYEAEELIHEATSDLDASGLAKEYWAGPIAWDGIQNYREVLLTEQGIEVARQLRRDSTVPSSQPGPQDWEAEQRPNEPAHKESAPGNTVEGGFHQNPSPRSRTVSVVRAKLEHTDPATRLGALTVLQYFGSEAKAAISSLQKALDDEDVSVRDGAREVLGVIESCVRLNERDAAGGG